MQTKLDKLKEDLRTICAKPAALWFSGGRDSLLLLDVMAKLELSFHILRFDDGWSRTQRDDVYRIISKYKMPLYSYPPVFAMLIGDGDSQVTLAAEYAIDRNGSSIPILRDLVEGDKCSIDIRIEQAKRPVPPVVFDTHIIGSRNADRHYAMGGKSPAPAAEFTVGSATFYAPLYDWSNNDVRVALGENGILAARPPEQNDTGNIAACTNCLTGKTEVFCPKEGKSIPAFEWSPTENLSSWRQAHNLEVS